MEVESILHNGSIYLDTNIFIYALEGYAEYSEVIRKIFRAIDQGAVQAVTSELTLAEALVKPFLVQDESLVALYQSVIQNSSVLSVHPLNRQLLIRAARTRAQTASRISLADAVHLATARSMQCHSFLTNDRRLLRQQPDDLAIILLEHLI
ncbi:MAG: type II toxin-antitoxin system VapC family toxin [Candidatus Electrothrix sp. AUS1_2]|nr:type II toxin-antitoxin system VapC family toxin [Candidatus Electrothrix sp. AUS1_2]